jgi:hypothetical protein
VYCNGNESDPPTEAQLERMARDAAHYRMHRRLDEAMIRNCAEAVEHFERILGKGPDTEKLRKIMPKREGSDDMN